MLGFMKVLPRFGNCGGPGHPEDDAARLFFSFPIRSLKFLLLHVYGPFLLIPLLFSNERVYCIFWIKQFPFLKNHDIHVNLPLILRCYSTNIRFQFLDVTI